MKRRRRVLPGVVAALLLLGLTPFACNGTGADNPCVRLRAEICAADSPMLDSGLCTKLRSEGDAPSPELRKRCEGALAEIR